MIKNTAGIVKLNARASMLIKRIIRWRRTVNEIGRRSAGHIVLPTGFYVAGVSSELHQTKIVVR